MKILQILCLFFFLGSLSHAEQRIINHVFDKNASFIKVDHLFDEHVKSGIHPYRVTIRNGRTRPVNWTIRFDTNSSNYDYESSYTITAEPGGEVTEELLVPSPPTQGHRYSNYRNIQILVTSPGIDSNNGSLNGSLEPDWPSIVMSRALAENNLSRLATRREEAGGGSGVQNFFASTFNDLPASWKGLTCVDVLLLTDSDWRALNKQQQRAVMTWVRFGGRIDLFSSEAEPTFASLGFDNPDQLDKAKGVYSLGSVAINNWNGKDLADSLISRYQNIEQADTTYDQDFVKGWGLIAKLGVKDFNPALVFILLIIFAILVGPVNLFHFAKAGQRHRLFITTPIIALSASIIIISIILLQDGMGGVGRRTAFVDVNSAPDQRHLQILQHQLSRTGVMLRSGFINEDAPVISPVKIPNSRWNPIQNGNNNSNYQFTGTNYGGEWFRSRSEQGFHLRSVKPSRSRIERRQPPSPDKPPSLFSSMEFELSEFHYIDENGSVWRAAPNATIQSGQEIALEKSDLGTLKAWLTKSGDGFAKTDQKRIRDLADQRLRYFATAPNPASLMVETHRSIDWVDDVTLVSGIAVNP